MASNKEDASRGQQRKTIPGFLREFPYVTGLYRLLWHNEKPLVPLVQWQGAGLLPGKTALEIGCGGGTNSLWLASRGYTVTASDWSAKALRIVDQKARARAVPLTLLQLDVTEPRPQLGKFDLVLDSYCLQDLPPAGQQAYARHLHDWLAPGAAFVVAACIVAPGGKRPLSPFMLEGQMQALFPDLTLEEIVPDSRRGAMAFRFRKPGAGVSSSA